MHNYILHLSLPSQGEGSLPYVTPIANIAPHPGDAEREKRNAVKRAMRALQEEWAREIRRCFVLTS